MKLRTALIAATLALSSTTASAWDAVSGTIGGASGDVFGALSFSSVTPTPTVVTSTRYATGVYAPSVVVVDPYPTYAVPAYDIYTVSPGYYTGAHAAGHYWRRHRALRHGDHMRGYHGYRGHGRGGAHHGGHKGRH